jgi:F-type H+-transporting ATPase subunit b
MAHGPSLFPDYTMAIQFGLFSGSWFVLHRFVFSPYQKLIHAREEKTTGLQEKSAKARELAEKLKTDYEAFMKSERKKIASWVESERKRIAESEHEILSEARNSASKQADVARQKISADQEKVRKELLPKTQDYAGQIVSKLIGYKVVVTGSVNKKSGQSAETSVT